MIAGLGGRAITSASLHGHARDALADGLEPLTFLDLDHATRRARAGARDRAGPHAENMLPRLGVAAEALMTRCPTRSERSRSATGCSPTEQRTVQADARRANALTSGHRACQGCGEALGARYASTPRCAPPRVS